jgi:hypothetical protein
MFAIAFAFETWLMLRRKMMPRVKTGTTVPCPYRAAAAPTYSIDLARRNS